MATVSIEIRFDERALHDFGQAETDKAANRVRNVLLGTTPVDEGILRASWVTEPDHTTADPATRIGSRVSYASNVELGTGIYGPSGMKITPKNGSVLRWPNKGGTSSGGRRFKGGKTSGFVFARSVRGQPGQHMLENALPAAFQ